MMPRAFLSLILFPSLRSATARNTSCRPPEHQPTPPKGKSRRNSPRYRYPPIAGRAGPTVGRRFLSRCSRRMLSSYYISTYPPSMNIYRINGRDDKKVVWLLYIHISTINEDTKSLAPFFDTSDIILFSFII
ncbi:uncharacterized protein DS421_6g178420 [Arachis hypogaea]|nr:uncharacterized protein DS421_6g178420 [Arachis hypogaea]